MHVACSVLPRPMSSHSAPCSLNRRRKANQFSPSCWYGRSVRLHLNGSTKSSTLLLSSRASRNPPSASLRATCAGDSPRGGAHPRARGSRGTSAANDRVAISRTAPTGSLIRPIRGTSSSTQHGASDVPSLETSAAATAAPPRRMAAASSASPASSSAGTTSASRPGRMSSGAAAASEASAPAAAPCSAAEPPPCTAAANAGLTSCNTRGRSDECTTGPSTFRSCNPSMMVWQAAGGEVVWGAAGGEVEPTSPTAAAAGGSRIRTRRSASARNPRAPAAMLASG
mmetsp:Transcript_19301/g.47818  ORF Transcript_19301/g.47818 Transcript_19301/m.47818 type:complete len:284 (-) Transcript_19301:267-1118(-)